MGAALVAPLTPQDVVLDDALSSMLRMVPLSHKWGRIPVVPVEMSGQSIRGQPLG
jgi:hypothetical protein